MNNKEIILENIKRNNDMDSRYEPILGIGSTLSRFPLVLQGNLTVLLPDTMIEEPFVDKAYKAGALVNLIKDPRKKEQEFEDLLEYLLELRDKYDFEYWAYTKVKITPSDGGEEIPFKLNRPQRRVLLKIDKLRVLGKPIRMIILKARQWGGSTLVQVYMAWIQIIHKTNWNSLIAAEINQQATNIRFMYTNLVKFYPGDITLKPFENMTNIKIIPERKNKITVGSMQTPESIRSDNIKMAHLSEVGLWKKTEGKEPKDLAQAILGTIKSLAYTMYVLESTAKGTGNFFHTTYQDSVDGLNNLVPVFVPWYDIEIYRTPFESEDELLDFYLSMNTYEKYLFEIGATLEGINWYREKLREFGGDSWRMRSEFPSTAKEAFQSTGRRVYPPAYVEQCRLNNKPPKWKGQLYADGDKGKDALRNIVFMERAEGELWIWEKPDKEIRVANRYLTVVDIGGASKGADWSIIESVHKVAIF